MVKTRSDEAKIQAFGDAADKPVSQVSQDAPRGKKRGGADLLLPLNTYENDLIKKAAKKSSRSFAGFVRLAALEKAESMLKSDK